MSLEDIEKKFYGGSPVSAEEKKEEAKESVPAPTPSAREVEQYSSPERVSAPSPWGSEKKSSGGGKKATVIVTALVVLLGIGTAFWVFSKFFNGNTREAQASVDLYAPLQAYRGVPFEARVDITNEEIEPIAGNLTLSLSSGLLAEGRSPQIEAEIPEIAPGETYTKKFPVFAVGPVASLEKFNAVFSYEGKESFRVESEKEIYIKESGIRLSVNRAQIEGENAKFEITVQYENVSGSSLSDVTLEARYPQEFTFLSANPSPQSGNGAWNIGELRPKASGKIVIQGTAVSSAQIPVRIPVLLSASVAGERFSLIEEAAVLSATPRPVIVTLTGAGANGFAGKIGGILSYGLRVKNNAGLDLADVVVKMKLEGKIGNFSKIETGGGNFNSQNGTIEWTAANIKKLRILGANDFADMTIRLPLLTAFPVQTASDKNFTVKGTIEVTSPTVPQGSSADKTFVSVPFETKIAGDMDVDVKAWRKDPSGITNTGAMPLTANKPTQYTIHWQVKSYATNMKNVKIQSALEPGARFTGVVKSTGITTPQVNERTNIVEWTIPLVEAGTGVLNAPLEGVFQIEVIPNIAQVGDTLPLLQKTTLTATDDFTGVAIQKSYEKITAEIPHDPTYKKGDEEVNQ